MSQKSRILRRSPRMGVLGASIGALLGTGLAVPAWGQDADEEAATDDSTIEELIVTGTRIRRDDFSAVQSTSVVTGEDMRNLGVFSVADMISQLPNNIATNTPETNTASAFFLGQSIANLRGLNTFFGTRTLTLVDSRRVPSTNSGGSVDLNTIPSALVSRIETVTGGSSATYGADALAGVVNIILDEDKDNVTVDLSYSTTDEGDGDNVEFSLGAGHVFFDGRGHWTFGLDHTDQEAINDCTTRDFCQRAVGYVQNGGFFGGTGRPYENIDNPPYPGQPHYIIQEGLRYALTPQGILWNDPLNTGRFYTFNDAGNDLVPLYHDASQYDIPLEAVHDLIRGQGPYGDTQYGAGETSYKGIPLRPSTDRQNLFTSFRYELESGIELDAQVSLGESTSTALQDAVNQSFAGVTVRPDNAFLMLGSPEMQAELLSRMVTLNNGFFSSIAPARGFVNCGAAGCEAVETVQGYSLYKEWSSQLDRQNTTDTETQRFSLGAEGPLFDGGWTWEAYASYGSSETTTEVEEYPSQNRMAMALDTILDQNGVPVCRVLYDDPNDPNDAGDIIRAQWLTYLEYNLGDTVAPGEPEHYLETLSEGCEPLNPFGLAATPESLAYAFPSIFEGAEQEQEALSFSVSGDAWRGFGAGPLRMAAGVDYSSQDTNNYTKPGRNEILAADFALNFGGAWSGRTQSKELFAELELPLLRDKWGADYLMINLADRRTLSESERTSGTPSSRKNYTSSWKASMVWQPVDLVRVRLTRSQDTRAPSARELYQTFNSAAGGGFTRSTANNPWREDDPNTSDNEQQDVYQSSPSGGNTQLTPERATNQTIGVVFTPGGVLQGLQLSVDYYETDIRGGVESVSTMQVISRCQLEVEAGVPVENRAYCGQIVFGPPDPDVPPELVTNPELGNIEIVNSSQENTSPYWSRGVDWSASYFTQFSGGGSLSTRLLATRYLEQSRDLGGYFARRNVAGQTGSNGLGEFFGGFGINYSPTPNLSGNLYMTYTKGAFSVTGQARYVGTGRLNLQTGWIGYGETGHLTELATGEITYVPFEPDPSPTGANRTRENTVSDPDLPSWTTVNLNFTYDFGRSRIANFDNFQSLSAFLNITNIGDRIPTFFSGSGAGGLNTTLFSGMGREYRLGVRMEF